MTCDQHVGDGPCEWCGRPLEAHRTASCIDCAGWGYVYGFEEDIEPCTTCDVAKVLPVTEILKREQESAA